MKFKTKLILLIVGTIIGLVLLIQIFVPQAEVEDNDGEQIPTSQIDEALESPSDVDGE